MRFVKSSQIVAFNWTKVELKLNCLLFSLFHSLTFNWTKVELKRNFDAVPNAKRASFNWTKVELKLILRNGTPHSQFSF